MNRFPAANVQILVIDVQERLIPVVDGSAVLIRGIARLLDTAALLKIPIYATEQYPKGLGATIGPIAERLSATPVAKMRFSALTPEIREDLRGDRAVVLAGIETHVCVAQTAADLVDAGFRVIVPRDAVSSRKATDHETALARMAGMGVIVTTSEALLFEWLESAEHAHFKTISKWVKEFDNEPLA